MMTTSVMLALALVQAPVSAFTLSGRWLDINDTFTARDKFGLACASAATGSNLTLFGGREASSVYISDVYTYNTATRQWVHQHPVTGIEGVAAMAFGRIGNTVWAFGGQTVGEPGVSSETQGFDLINEQWISPVIAGTPPSARRRPGSWVFEDSLVVFGGLTGAEASSAVYSFNTSTSTWALLAADLSATNAGPTPRFDPCCVVVPSTGKTLCFGGTTANGDSSEAWEFDNVAKAWSLRATTGTTPSARRLAMCAIVNGEIMVWAGWDSALGAFVPDTTLHLLDLATGAWRQVAQPSTLETRDSGGMCSVGADVYLLGGARNSGRSNELFKLDTATMQFDLLSEGGSRPPARAYHTSVSIGTDMYVGFGYDGTSRLNDVWKFDTLARAWSSVSTTGTAPEPRSNTCASPRGTLVLVYGGQSDLGDELSDLWAINIETKAWTQQTTQGTSPGARSEHVCFFINPELFVVGLGNVNGAITDTWFVYNVADQTWTPLTSRSGVHPLARTGAFAQKVNSTHAMVGLGIGSATYNDRWYMSNVAYNATAGAYEADWEELASTIPVGVSQRKYIRGESAVSVVGSHALICGGALSSSFPAPPDVSCFGYDGGSGGNLPFPGAAYTAAGASSEHIGNTVYMFGGRLGSATVKRNVYLRTLMSVQLSNPCPFGSADDTSCVHCSPGSINPTCEPSPTGVYAEVAYQSPVECSPGEYQNRIGAASSIACTPCAAGTYSDIAGSSVCTACPTHTTCNVGASSTNASFTEQPIDEGISQPARLAPLEVPWSLIGIIAAGLLLMFVITMALMRWKSHISINSLDMFSDSHRSGFVGTELRVVKTTYGGAAFMTAIIAMTTISAALITTHFYENLEESKGSVPRQVIQSRFTSDTIVADLTIEASIAGVARTVNGESTFRGHCLNNLTGECVGKVSTVTGSVGTGGTWRTQCSYNTEYEVCSMTAICEGCSVGVSQSATVRFDFGAGLSADYVDYTVVATTGIRNPSVSSFGWVTPITDIDLDSIATKRLRAVGGIFSGLPATSIPVSLQPTYFVAPSTVLHSQDTFNNRFRATGYHLDLHTDPTPGNTVDHSLFGQYFGVPVDFVLTSESTALFVERTLRKSEVEMISQVLGALTGVAAAAVIAMQMMDKNWFKSRVRSCFGENFCRCLWLDLEKYADEEILRAKENQRYHPRFDDSARERQLRKQLEDLIEVEKFRARIEAGGPPVIPSENEDDDHDDKEATSRTHLPAPELDRDDEGFSDIGSQSGDIGVHRDMSYASV